MDNGYTRNEILHYVQNDRLEKEVQEISLLSGELGVSPKPQNPPP